MNFLSFKTSFGWISICEEKDKIVRIRFGKCKNRSGGIILKKNY